MKKKDILFKLDKELQKAKGRQFPHARTDSGYMRGLKRAIEIIKTHK